MVLRDLYKKHHRQVAGPTFYQLHLLFDKHSDAQVELVGLPAELLAERIQLLGDISIAMAQDVAETTIIARPPRHAVCRLRTRSAAGRLVRRGRRCAPMATIAPPTPDTIAPPLSYDLNLRVAGQMGVSAEQVEGVLAAIAPVAGGPRVVAAAGNILRAVGIEIAVAEAELAAELAAEDAAGRVG
jgi:Ferritin-like domain